MSTQLEGVITLGGTDYSDEISEFLIDVTRSTVTEAATYGDATENDKAGPQKASVTITCKNELAAASVARELWTALLTDSAELAFTARYATGAASTDNLEYSGNLVVTGVQIGTKAGEDREMSQTFPANTITTDDGS